MARLSCLHLHKCIGEREQKMRSCKGNILGCWRRGKDVIQTCITNIIGETVFLSMCILSKCGVSINNHYLPSVATEESGLANHLPSGR